MTRFEVAQHRGWEILRLSAPPLSVDVVPGKGADILAVRWAGLDLLWKSPWGLRQRGSASGANDSAERWIESYPGGWQVVFPNGGDAVLEDGIEWGFHGEAALASWDWELVTDGPDAVEVELATHLARHPFALSRTIRLDGDGLHVRERIRNTGGRVQDAMWSHHPAFGAPFLEGGCTVEVAASTFVADDLRDVPAGDLQPGEFSPWPHGRTRDGRTADLSVIPEEGSGIDRFGYLTDLERGRVRITNPRRRLAAELTWDADAMPHAWYWLEANATPSYPWYQQAYVFAIEPAASWPGQGLHAVREKTQTELRFEAGEEREVTVSLGVVET